MTRKKLRLADLLAKCDPAAPYAGEVWAEVPPVGREFGAPLNDATIRTLVTLALAAQDGPSQHALRALADGCGLVTQVQTMVEESGDPEGFDAAGWTCAWLVEPNPALGGQLPAECMATGEGRARVSNLLAMAQSGAYG
jgi:hypothetical protein